MSQLTNTMFVTAEFNDMTTTAQSTVVVELGNMTLIKSADKNPWTDGELTYTVTLENIEQAGDITDIVFTDTIDISKSQLNTASVAINGVIIQMGPGGFTYDPVDGSLRIPYGEALIPGETVTITFRVTKV